MQFFRHLANRISEARRRYKAYNELMQLDDRTLSDIGVVRSQIEAAVLGTLDKRSAALPLSAAAPELRLVANRNHFHKAA